MNRVSARPSSSAPNTPAQPSTSAIFPALRKLDLSSDPLAQPLVTLTLSAPSFLDSVVKDDFSSTPLYIIETHQDRTGIYRCDSDVHSVARLQWPTATKMASANAVALSGITVQMHGGRWRPTEEFMKFGSLFTSRKFNIPHHLHSFKWKRVGPSFNCTCASVKGPVAILEAAVLSAPPRLRIYSSLLREVDTSRPQPNFGGVPYALMDYLVTTSLILVTDIEEWMHRPVDDVEAARSTMESFLPESMRNWRKNRTSSLISSSPSSSVHNLPAKWPDDGRGTVSELGTISTPSPSTPHPYSISHVSNQDDIPPVPEIPVEHHTSIAPLTRSITLGRRRELPKPPGQLMQGPRSDQPWLHDRPHSEPSTSGSSELESTLQLVSPPTTPPPLDSSGSINRRPLPIQRPPPQLPVPLPPKLMNELHRSRVTANMRNSISSIDEYPIEEAGPSSQPEHEEGQEQGSTHDVTAFNNIPGVRDSFYELPPPAYDAIDFSMPRPPLPDLPTTF
jgi:hypothetical protein